MAPHSDGCDLEYPDTRITEITIEREGGCLGYFVPADYHGKGPAFYTGPCAGYELTLRSDGTAAYSGENNVPVLGKQVGLFDVKDFRRLAALASEIRFESWESDYRPVVKKAGFTCIRLDGEMPVTVSITVAGHRKSIRHEPESSGPA